jgi:IS5 family transposase
LTTFSVPALIKSIGEAGVEELLKATIDTAVQTKVVAPKEFERVIVDTSVQEKTIAHPVDSRLLEIASGKAIPTRLAAWTALKQTYAKEGKALRCNAGGYAHAERIQK